MTSLFLLLAAPAWADSSDRSAKEWSDWVVDQIDAYGKSVQQMQEEADASRNLAASRCLAPRSGELERLSRQGDQARERYEAALKDDSDYAQAMAEQELGELLSRAETQYSLASGCGMPLVPVDSPRSGLSGLGGVRELAWRASDGASLGPAYVTVGLDLESGWEGNALLQASDPTGSLMAAMTPQMGMNVDWRSWSLYTDAQTRLAKWSGAPARDELGTWDATGQLMWRWGDISASGAGFSQRQTGVVTPWPELSAPYVTSSNAVNLDLRGDWRGRVGVAAWAGLLERSYQEGGLDRSRQSLPVHGELILGGGYEGLVLQGTYERFAWESQDDLALQPLDQGALITATAGIRRFGDGFLNTMYGLAWVDGGAGMERSWVGSTDLDFSLSRFTVGAYHSHSFSDHWLAPTATHHEAGGRLSAEARGGQAYGRGGWGVERPGDLALRSVSFTGGLRYELPLNSAVDLSAGWERRTAIEGTDESLGYTNPKVMLTLEVF